MFPLPIYIPPAKGTLNEFRISGIDMDGIAGMMSVTVTSASVITLLSASLTVTRNVLSVAPLAGLGLVVNLIFALDCCAFSGVVVGPAVFSLYSFDPPNMPVIP